METLFCDRKGSSSPSFTTCSYPSSKNASCKLKEAECSVISSLATIEKSKHCVSVPRNRKKRMDARTYKALFRPRVKNSKHLGFSKHGKDVMNVLGEKCLKDTYKIKEISDNQAEVPEEKDQFDSAAISVEMRSKFNVAIKLTTASWQRKCSDCRSPESNFKHDQMVPKCTNTSHQISLGVGVCKDISHDLHENSEFSERVSTALEEKSNISKDLACCLGNSSSLTDIGSKAPSTEPVFFLPMSSRDGFGDSFASFNKQNSSKCGEMASSSKPAPEQAEPIGRKYSEKEVKSSCLQRQKEKLSHQLSLTKDSSRSDTPYSPLSMTGNKDVTRENLIKTSSESDLEEGEIAESEREEGEIVESEPKEGEGEIRPSEKNFMHREYKIMQPAQHTSIKVVPVNAPGVLDLSKKESLSKQLSLIEEISARRMKELLQKQMHELTEFKRFRETEKMKIDRTHSIKMSNIMDEFDQHFKSQRRKLVVMQISARKKEKQLKDQWLKGAFAGKIEKSFDAISLSSSEFEVQGFVEAFCQSHGHFLEKHSPAVGPSCIVRESLTDGLTDCNVIKSAKKSYEIKADDRVCDRLDAASRTIEINGFGEQTLATCGVSIGPPTKAPSMPECPSSSHKSSTLSNEPLSVIRERLASSDAVGSEQVRIMCTDMVALVQQESNSLLQIEVDSAHLNDDVQSVDRKSHAFSDRLNSGLKLSSSDPVESLPSESATVQLSVERERHVSDKIGGGQFMSSSARSPVQHAHNESSVRHERSSGADSSQVHHFSELTVTPTFLVSPPGRHEIHSVSGSAESEQMIIYQQSTKSLQSADNVCPIEQEALTMPDGLGSEQVLNSLQMKDVTTSLQMVITCDESCRGQLLNSSPEAVVPGLQSIDYVMPLVSPEWSSIPEVGCQSEIIQAKCPRTSISVVDTDSRSLFAIAENNQGPSQLLITESELQLTAFIELQSQFSRSTVAISDPIELQISGGAPLFPNEQGITNASCIGENALVPWSVMCNNTEVPACDQNGIITPEEDLPASLSGASQQNSHASVHTGVAPTGDLPEPALDFAQRFFITTPLPCGLHPEPLQNELFRICREEDLAAQICENTKLEINSECQKEIEKIMKKYNILLQDVETEFMEKKKKLDMISSKVHMNKILAVEFRSMFSDNKNVEATTLPTEGVNGLHSSFTQLLLQNSQRPSMSRPLAVAPVLIPDLSAAPFANTGAACHQRLSSVLAPTSSLPQMRPAAAVQHRPALFSASSGRPQYDQVLLPGANQIRSCYRAPAPHLNRYRPPPSIPVAHLPIQSDMILNRQQPQIAHLYPSATSYSDLSRGATSGIQQLGGPNSLLALDGLFSNVELSAGRHDRA